MPARRGAPRGPRTRLVVRLDAATHQALEQLSHGLSVPAGLARRARLVLLMHEGRTVTEVALMVGISRRHVYKWIWRFARDGITGLQERPMPRGRKHRRGGLIPEVGAGPGPQAT